MTRQCQRQFLALNAAAVVADFEQLRAARGKLHGDVGGTGIETVFEQLFERRGRPLDHFAGSDLIDQQIG